MRSSSEKVRLWRTWDAVSCAVLVGSLTGGTYAASVGQEVRADGLDLAVVGLAEGADRLEVLLAGPALGQHGQRQVDLDVGHCCGRCGRCSRCSWVVGTRFCQ